VTSEPPTFKRPGLISNARLAGLFSLLVAGLSVLGQTPPPENIATRCATAGLNRGVVVESVARNSEGEKAGLGEGDTILSWSRGDAKGEIESPFDLSEIETEQEPRGWVTLEGTRGGRTQTWVVGLDKWGIQARPSLPESLLVIYRDGQELTKVGKLSDAAERWRAAAVEGDRYQCSWLSPWFLFHAAEALGDARQWKESDALYQEAMVQAADAGPEIKAQFLRALADGSHQQRDLASAEKYYRQAGLEMQKSGAENLATAKNLNDLGSTLREQGDLGNAEQYLSQALTIAEKVAPGSLAVAASLVDLGDVADDRRDLAKAEEYNLQALEIRQKLASGGRAVAESLNNLGIVALRRGDLAKAKEYFRQGLEIREKLAPGSLDVATTLNNLGVVAWGRGDLATAEEYFRQGLEIREKLAPGSLDVAASLNNIGGVAGDRGNLAQAEDYFRRDMAITEKLAPGSLDVATTLNNLGHVALERGDLVKAEEYQRQAHAIREKLAPGSLDVAASLSYLGEIARDRGDLAEAEEYFHQGLAITEKLAPGSLDLSTNLNNLGVVARDRGNLAKAEAYFRQGQQIREKLAPGSLDVAASLSYLGEIARHRGDLAEAEEYFHQGLAITQKLAPGSLDMASDLNNLGEVASDRGNLAEGEEYYRQALEIRKKLAPQTTDYAESLAALAGILRDKQQADEAVRLYAEAIDVLENQLARLGGSSDIRAGFRAKHADYYSAYADLLLTQKQPELAFQVLERSRARTLLETLTETHVDIRQGADPSLLERERTLQITLAAKSNRKISLLGSEHTDEQVAAFNKEIGELLSQYQEVEGQVRISSPGYAALTQPQPLSAKEVQRQLLDADTVLLEYALGEKRSFVFVLTPTSLDSYELPMRSEIEAGAHRVYDLLTSRNRWIRGETSLQRKARVAKADAEYQKTSATLSQMILGPVAARIEGKRLLIVADGALQYIPVSVLPVPAGDTPKRAVPLVAEHEIVNLPSASVLAVLRRQSKDRAPGPKEVAVLADPVFDKDDPRVGKAQKGKRRLQLGSARATIPSLPDQLTRSLGDVGLGTRQVGSALPRLAFSRREADAILAMTNSGKGLEALDFRASRETALSKDLDQYRIVHFATHSLLDNEHPELSGLVLSLVDQEGNPRDGFLDLQDVYNLSLPVDLIVLSACETGLGKEINGEGLVGLTRGFMYAGASRVVASLWNVDDAATADLMARFYQGMLKEGMRPAAALRQAQLDMWKQKRWRDPYYWAAFTIQGDWR
jgi:CHAT domain-containing protein/Tfp pilus assembly protein PilF